MHWSIILESGLSRFIYLRNNILKKLKINLRSLSGASLIEILDDLIHNMAISSHGSPDHY